MIIIKLVLLLLFLFILYLFVTIFQQVKKWLSAKNEVCPSCQVVIQVLETNMVCPKCGVKLGRNQKGELLIRIN